MAPSARINHASIRHSHQCNTFMEWTSFVLTSSPRFPEMSPIKHVWRLDGGGSLTSNPLSTDHCLWCDKKGARSMARCPKMTLLWHGYHGFFITINCLHSSLRPHSCTLPRCSSFIGEHRSGFDKSETFKLISLTPPTHAICFVWFGYATNLFRLLKSVQRLCLTTSCCTLKIKEAVREQKRAELVLRIAYREMETSTLRNSCQRIQHR